MELLEIYALLVIVTIVVSLLTLRGIKRVMKIIHFEDSLKINLHKPLTIGAYEKLFKNEFEPYKLATTTKFNTDIYDEFMNDIDDIKAYEFIQDSQWEIVFLNKINGWFEEDPGVHTLILEEENVYTVEDPNKLEIIRKFYEEENDARKEVSLDGIYRVNNIDFMLSELTSINIFVNQIGQMSMTTIMFNFGYHVETITLNSFKEAFDYLFKNDQADIRLIQKIANSSITKFEVN